MKNPWNPTPDEVRQWAYQPDSPEPCQDWELALSWAQHEKAYLELASDENCPKRQFFLHVLYFIVGKAVEDDFRSRPKPIIEGFIRRGDDSPHPDIKIWQERSIYLLRHPETFNYADWCGYGFVKPYKLSSKEP